MKTSVALRNYGLVPAWEDSLDELNVNPFTAMVADQITRAMSPTQLRTYVSSKRPADKLQAWHLGIAEAAGWYRELYDLARRTHPTGHAGMGGTDVMGGVRKQIDWVRLVHYLREALRLIAIASASQ